MIEPEWSHVEEVVAAGDPDRFVASFFAPASRRGALLALYAFDQELARIAVTAREPMAGHIRLAWWREQIAALYAGDVLQAPLPRALAIAVRVHKLPRELIEHYLDARGFDLEETPFHDAAAMRAHAMATAGGIIRLGARVLGAEHRADEAAESAGIAVACGKHLSDLGIFAARRRCRFPVSWLHEGGLNAEDVFAAGGGSAALRLVFKRMQDEVLVALTALNHGRFPRAATPVLAVASLARWAAARGFDPIAPAAMPSWQRLARLSFANLTWRF